MMETADQTAARLRWWTDARFGMFIHWVRYAQFLHDGSEIRPGAPPVNVTYNENLAIADICLLLPVAKPDTDIPVIELLLTD